MYKMGIILSHDHNLKPQYNDIEYINSPKKHCPIKPFPITQPIPINNRNIQKYLQDSLQVQEQRESKSLPSLFEENMINIKQEVHDRSDSGKTMGRYISSKRIDGYNFSPTHFKNLAIHDRK